MAALTWTGAAGTAWSDANNWSPQQRPGIGDDLTFPDGALNKNNFNDLGNGKNFHSLTFTGSGYTLTGNRIELNRDGVAIRTNSGLNFINLPINFDYSYIAPRDYDIDVGTNGTLVINGVISGGLDESLRKFGNGNLILNAANTYTMHTGLIAGTITVQNGAALGSARDLGLTIIENGTVALQNNITVPEDFFLIGSGSSLSSPSGNNTVTGAVTLSGTSNLNVASGSRLTITGVVEDDDITPAEGGWQKTGAGELVLTGANTNSEDNVIANGQVTIQNNNALGTAEGDTTVLGNAILAVSGTRTIAEDVELDSTASPGAVAELAAFNGSNVTWNGQVDPDGNARFRAIGSGKLKLNQKVTLLTNENVIVTGGIVVNGLTPSIAGGAVEFAGGLELPLSSAASLAVGGGATANISGGLRGIGQLNIGADALPGGGKVLLAGPGANTHTGTINVNGAILEVNVTAASSVVVNGGTLRGIGTVANVNAISGRVNPGTDQNGRLTVANNFLIDEAATFQIDLSSNSADQLRVTGTVDLQDAILDVRDPNGTPVGASFRIIDNLGGDDVEGKFEGLFDGDRFTVNSANGPEVFEIDYDGGDGNDVVITRKDTGTMAPGIAITPSIQEGQVAHLKGKLVDPDVGDRLTLVVNWGDGSKPETFRPGLQDFDITHRYVDNPTGTTQYIVRTSWFDNHGAGNSRDLPITVTNVAPILYSPDVRFAGNNQVFVSGRIADPGQDSFKLVINWGDGQTNTYQYATGTDRFQVQHRYTAAGRYEVSLSLTDDDGGQDIEAMIVHLAQSGKKNDLWWKALSDFLGPTGKS